MEKLANEWVVQARLPFLNEGKFKAAKSLFSLYKPFVVELKIFSGTTVLPIKGVMV